MAGLSTKNNPDKSVSRLMAVRHQAFELGGDISWEMLEETVDEESGELGSVGEGAMSQKLPVGRRRRRGRNATEQGWQ